MSYGFFTFLKITHVYAEAPDFVDIVLRFRFPDFTHAAQIYAQYAVFKSAGYLCVDFRILLCIVAKQNKFLMRKFFEHAHNTHKFSAMLCLSGFHYLIPSLQLTKQAHAFGYAVASLKLLNIVVQVPFAA